MIVIALHFGWPLFHSVDELGGNADPAARAFLDLTRHGLLKQSHPAISAAVWEFADGELGSEPASPQTGKSERVAVSERDACASIVNLDPELFGADALQGLESFSHVEIFYLFDRVEDAEISTSARHPSGRTDWPKVGIFAQRGKGRPNRIGAKICKIESVDGTELRLRGLDAINGTPVIDIKPVMSGFQPRGNFREPDWAREIMQDYWTESAPKG